MSFSRSHFCHRLGMMHFGSPRREPQEYRNHRNHGSTDNHRNHRIAGPQEAHEHKKHWTTGSTGPQEAQEHRKHHSSMQVMACSFG